MGRTRPVGENRKLVGSWEKGKTSQRKEKEIGQQAMYVLGQAGERAWFGPLGGLNLGLLDILSWGKMGLNWALV